MIKIDELMEALKKRDEDKNKNTVLWVLAIVGAVAAVAGIAYAVYRYFAPDYLEDFDDEDDFEDDFDDFPAQNVPDISPDDFDVDMLGAEDILQKIIEESTVV